MLKFIGQVLGLQDGPLHSYELFVPSHGEVSGTSSQGVGFAASLTRTVLDPEVEAGKELCPARLAASLDLCGRRGLSVHKCSFRWRRVTMRDGGEPEEKKALYSGRVGQMWRVFVLQLFTRVKREGEESKGKAAERWSLNSETVGPM